MKTSDLFVKALENEGVQWIFGIPGEENLDFLDSLRQSDKIQLVLTRHEQAAGFMAAIYGRLTGKTGVCISTLGPGATNFCTAAAYATLGGFPMLMLTGQKPIKKSKQGQFQILNIVEHMKPVTKFSKQIVNGELVPSLTREAFRSAEGEKPGAVLLELPEDIAAELVPDDAAVHEGSNPRRPVPDEKAVHVAVEMIKAARSPLLCFGGGCNRKRTQKMLLEFVDKTGIPFFNTQMGKGVIDERHPLFLGTAALSANDYLHCAIEQADLIVNLGHDVVEKPPFFMHQGDGRKVIHVNFFPYQVDPVYFPTHEVVGDIANSVWQMKEILEKQASWDFGGYMRVKAGLEKHLLDHTTDGEFPMVPQRIVADVRKVIPSDGIICLDNGMYKIWFARNYKAYEPNTVLLDNALATMGAGLPSAIAAKMTLPDKKVLAVCGDGGFLMNSQELETAVRIGVNITVLILNDNAFGMIKWKQTGMGLPKFGLDYQNPDFVKYAEAYGCNGYRVGSADELSKILETCISSTTGVHLIDCPISYALSDEVLIKQLAEKVCII